MWAVPSLKCDATGKDTSMGFRVTTDHHQAQGQAWYMFDGTDEYGMQLTTTQSITVQRITLKHRVHAINRVWIYSKASALPTMIRVYMMQGLETRQQISSEHLEPLLWTTYNASGQCFTAVDIDPQLCQADMYIHGYVFEFSGTHMELYRILPEYDLWWFNVNETTQLTQLMLHAQTEANNVLHDRYISLMGIMGCMVGAAMRLPPSTHLPTVHAKPRVLTGTTARVEQIRTICQRTITKHLKQNTNTVVMVQELMDQVVHTEQGVGSTVCCIMYTCFVLMITTCMLIIKLQWA